ncbi:hypothetical protein RchiOBHm_Chr3g0487861 [Rosa chinensis]|nr:hypothetical protein RchiOBHm_Chr3g0487861 [Rosa chinensis]
MIKNSRREKTDLGFLSPPLLTMLGSSSSERDFAERFVERTK